MGDSSAQCLDTLSSLARQIAVEEIQGFQIIGPLERRRLDHGVLAHTTPHLSGGEVLVLLHPLVQLFQELPDALRAMQQ